MRILRFLIVCLLLFVVAGLLGYLYLDREMSKFQTPVTSAPIEIPPGLGAQAVVHLLHKHGVIGNEPLTMAWLVISGKRKALRAGEYVFDRPVTTREVIDKLVSGEIFLHRFTVPEGLTLSQIAAEWKQQGFGEMEEFLTAAQEAVPLVKEFEGENREASVEGYLFPETYFFPLHTSAARAIEMMVGRFRNVLTQLTQRTPAESWPLSVRETVILASLVEEEAAVEDERPLIASVFLNRLKSRILLQCDPTVIYALEKNNEYRGRLTTGDLRYDSPYNTYRYAGLPPGAIANPGRHSLEAAVNPAASHYLYFVRTTEGRHTFSETLAAHNRAVAAYRAMQRLNKQ